MTFADILPLFAPSLAPAAVDRAVVKDRKQKIVDALEGDGLKVVTTFEAGSFSHGTGVRAHSDVDLMVWVTHEQQTHLPSSILNRFRHALVLSTHVASASVSNPAVRTEFWSDPRFEVVPAFTSGKTDVFEIGGRRDEWVLSSPKSHNRYVNEQNDRLSKRVKPLVRLLKAWKYHIEVPISSFYLEMRAAQHAAGEATIILDIDLRAVIRKAISINVADINDPTGLTGRIPACASEDKRAAAKRAMVDALANLEAADTRREADDKVGYWYHMSKVFGSSFPMP